MDRRREEEIRNRALARDPAAWRDLERLCRPPLAAVLRRRFSPADVDDAWADVAHDLLRRDMRKLRAWDPARCSLASWVVLLGRHCAEDARRRRWREVPAVVSPGALGAREGVAHGRAVAREGAAHLLVAAERLPPALRRYFRALFVEGTRAATQGAYHARHRILRRLAPLVGEALA